MTLQADERGGKYIKNDSAGQGQEDVGGAPGFHLQMFVRGVVKRPNTIADAPRGVVKRLNTIVDALRGVVKRATTIVDTLR